MTRFAYPSQDDLQRFLDWRYRKGWVWQVIFLTSLLIAILSLSALILDVVDSAFGYVAYEFKTDPALVTDKDLDDLNKEELIALLQENLSRGAYNKLNNEIPMESRSEGELYNLVIERIIQINTLETYSLFDSIFNKAAIEAEAAELYPDYSLVYTNLGIL
ncbi:MAG TPA: hypothetical protein PLF42_06315, partial [Anaerolineales bacterium]|nr:hypothetical protein [Anaerolineales bacterium]